jgi:hypothetical protein
MPQGCGTGRSRSVDGEDPLERCIGAAQSLSFPHMAEGRGHARCLTPTALGRCHNRMVAAWTWLKSRRPTMMSP